MCFYCFSGEWCGQQAGERGGEKGVLVRHCQTAWSTVSHLPMQNRMRLISSVTPALGTLLICVWVKQASTHETEKSIFLHPCVQQPWAGPPHTWSYRAAVGNLLTILSRCRRPGSILLACFPASGDSIVPAGAKCLFVSANAPLRHIGRVSGKGSCNFYSLTFLTPCTLWWVLHIKTPPIYIKRRATYVPFYLWKFLLSLLFSS